MTSTEIRIEKNTQWLKSNREAIIAEYNDLMEWAYMKQTNVTLKQTMVVLLDEVATYAEYSISNLSTLVENAINTAKNNAICGDVHPQDFFRAAARRQAINL